MDTATRHSLILRMYCDLARGRHFATRMTDEVMLTDVAASDRHEPLTAASLNWTADEGLREMMVKRWGEKGAARFDNGIMFSKPSWLQNRIYSVALQRAFTAPVLSEMDAFDSQGVFRLADGHGFYVARESGKKVIAIEFMRYSVFR